MSIAVMAGTLVIFVAAIYLLQRSMIYFPRQYSAYDTQWLPERAVELDYTTSEGRQIAFYLPPEEARQAPKGERGDSEDAGAKNNSEANDRPRALPERLWLTFGGNAARALDWVELAEKHADPQAAFLLIDYPGYGHCEGKPSATAILESTEAAVARLATWLGVSPDDLDGRYCFLAHSIGAGAALQFASPPDKEGPPRRVQRLVLISPFTSLADMAKRSVGWPLCLLLRDHYDNRARLKELIAAAEKDPARAAPAITIIHGSSDQIIPVRMGRELANLFADHIQYKEIKGADHNYILSTAEPLILEAMRDNP